MATGAHTLVEGKIIMKAAHRKAHVVVWPLVLLAVLGMVVWLLTNDVGVSSGPAIERAQSQSQP